MRTPKGYTVSEKTISFIDYQNMVNSHYNEENQQNRMDEGLFQIRLAIEHRMNKSRKFVTFQNLKNYVDVDEKHWDEFLDSIPKLENTEGRLRVEFPKNKEEEKQFELKIIIE